MSEQRPAERLRPVQIPALTALRFFAAALVVLFHYGIGFNESLGHAGPLNGVFGFGYEAVSFFFVLSGFILSYTHGLPDGTMNVSARRFVFLRAIKILPAYYLALLIAAPFFFAILIKNQSHLSSLLLVPALLQAWFPPLALDWNLPAWSLSNEIFFYILFPYIWLRAARWLIGLSAGVTVALLLCASLVKALLLNDGSIWSRNAADYFPLLNLPQFVLGCVMARVFFARGLFSKAVHCAAFIGALALLGVIMEFKPYIAAASDPIVLCAVFCVVIFSSLRSDIWPTRLLAWRPLIILGEASYAAYILHLPIWSWWNHVTRYVLHVELGFSLNLLLYMAVVWTLSLGVYYFVERPAKDIMRARKSLAVQNTQTASQQPTVG